MAPEESGRNSHAEPSQADADFDVIVVGGGPAGMIAAGRASECGCRVLLLEKNRRVGEKLLITGGGRCNVTNATADRHALTSRYGDGGKHLHSIFARFTPEDMRAFLRRFGLETKVEAENRVFPVTDDAASVRDVLVRYMREGGVTVRTGVAVKRLVPDGSGIRGVETGDGEVITARHYILAAGGASRPETGSTGEAFGWLRDLGLPVRENDSALVPLIVPDSWVHSLQGLAIDDASLHVELLGADARERAADKVGPAAADRGSGRDRGGSPTGPEAAPGAARTPSLSVYDRSLWGNAKRTMSRRGKLLFTHFGLSGPLALNAAEEVQARAQEGAIRLVIDLLPGTDEDKIDAFLRRAADTHGKRTIRRVLDDLVPKRLTRALCELADVDPATRAATLSKKQRRALTERAKAMPCRFDGLMGADKAVVSSGGLNPRAVDFRTMRLHDYPELSVLGDMLDFNRRSGGYSLQICWASGWVAGEACAEEM